MSRLHVNQIGGFLRAQLDGHIDMKDCSNHPTDHKNTVFYTRALACLAVANLTETSLTDLGSCVTDGSRDGGVDLIFFDSKERTLYLCQTKWHQDGHGSFDLGDTLKFIEGVKTVLDNNLDDLNEKIKSKKPDIEQALFDANAKFVLVLAHTGQEEFSPDIQSKIDSYIESQNDTSEIMKVRILKQPELHKMVAAGMAGAPVSVEVQISNWGQIRTPHHAIYGQVCAADVALWMTTHGPRLFESNLRQFLGSSNTNQDIVATLTDRPEDFWYFNNGITAITDSLAKKPLGGNSTESGIFECSGFSVVNGAQTVGAIHTAFALNSEAVSKAMVPLRIISKAQSRPEFGTEVTKCTNTQNAIERRDFVALDPEQERIRLELHIDGIEYIYKTGTITSTSRQKFDLTEATVALACSGHDVNLAVQAKREIGKLWEDITKAPYKQIFNKGITGPMIWEKVKLLRSVEKTLTDHSKSFDGRDSLICIHGNRFIQWAAMRELAKHHQPDDLTIQTIIPQVTQSVIAIIKSKFSDSYPASLFKNLGKCRILAAELENIGKL